MTEPQEPRFIVEPGSAHADEVRHAALFRSNAAHLLAEWPRLLGEHRGQWAAVYGDGEPIIITAPTLEELWAQVPEQQRHDAIVKYLVDPAIEAVAKRG